MKERPILFNSPMVRAILEGRKTQTRRVMKDRFLDVNAIVDGPCEGFRCMEDDRAVFDLQQTVDSSWPYPIRCPYGKPGDRLWVRETWFCEGREQPGQGLHYRANASDADEAWFKEEGWKWKPSIFMPRWASRIDLEVSGVRVERVQEITRDDAMAEGIEQHVAGGGHEYDNRTSVQNFAVLWDSINAKRGFGWESNPWVWVMEFRVIEGATP